MVFLICVRTLEILSLLFYSVKLVLRHHSWGNWPSVVDIRAHGAAGVVHIPWHGVIRTKSGISCSATVLDRNQDNITEFLWRTFRLQTNLARRLLAFGGAVLE